MKYLVIKSFPDSETYSKWDSFLTDADLATHYSTPNYFLDPCVRADRFAVAAVDGEGEFQAVLTGVSNASPLSSELFSRPQIAFRRGIDSGEATRSLIAGVTEAFPAASLIEIFSWNELSAAGFRSSSSTDEMSVVILDLAKGSEAIFAGFSQTRRNEIRKAERSNLLEIKEIETKSETAELYKLHCDWNRTKGHQPDAFEMFQLSIAQRENRRTFIAKVDGNVVAGSFFRFAANGVVEYAANNSKPEFQRLRPNDVLVWHAIKWACESGFTHFSMGGSNLFLRRFGGEIKTTYRYRRDMSIIKKHEIRELAMAAGVGAYRRLPSGVRSRLSGLMAR